MNFATRKKYYNRCDPSEPLEPGDARLSYDPKDARDTKDIQDGR